MGSWFEDAWADEPDTDPSDPDEWPDGVVQFIDDLCEFVEGRDAALKDATVAPDDDSYFRTVTTDFALPVRAKGSACHDPESESRSVVDHHVRAAQQLIDAVAEFAYYHDTGPTGYTIGHRAAEGGLVTVSTTFQVNPRYPDIPELQYPGSSDA